MEMPTGDKKSSIGLFRTERIKFMKSKKKDIFLL